MRSKSWIFILVIGVGGVCVMGLITKFALESNPTLRRITKLKQALAKDYSSEGIEEVSVRVLPRRRGYEIRLHAPRDGCANPEVLVGRVADSFLKDSSGPMLPRIQVFLVEPGSFGCRGSNVYFEKEISTQELVAQNQFQAALDRLAASIPSQLGYKFRPARLEDPLNLDVEIPRPADDGELERAVSLLKDKTREHLSAGKSRTVVLHLWSSGGEQLLREERLERPAVQKRGRKAPASAGPAGPDQR